jgi:hypothetical protein
MFSPIYRRDTSTAKTTKDEDRNEAACFWPSATAILIPARDCQVYVFCLRFLSAFFVCVLCLRSLSTGQSLTGTDRKQSVALETSFNAIPKKVLTNKLPNFQEVHGW